jgi:hypothetical protein
MKPTHTIFLVLKKNKNKSHDGHEIATCDYYPCVHSSDGTVEGDSHRTDFQIEQKWQTYYKMTTFNDTSPLPNRVIQTGPALCAVRDEAGKKK